MLATQLAGLGVTRWRIPPFLVAWLVPLAIAVAIGYTRPTWEGLTLTPPFATSAGLFTGLGPAIQYMPVIIPMAVYLVLQDVAANAAASVGGDTYPIGWVIAWDAIATIVCGLAGSVITPVLYAVHGPYKATGARINYTWWSAAAFFVVVVTGLSSFVGQLFPWPILAALISSVAVGVGLAALRSTPSRHHGALLLAFVLPGAAVVASAVSTTVAALNMSTNDPTIVAALEASVHWGSLQSLANGFLLLVLVISAVLVEMVDRRFSFASVWCLIAAGLSWIGLLHGSRLGWGVGPQATLGWLLAAVVMYSARWWSTDAVSHDKA